MRGSFISFKWFICIFDNVPIGGAKELFDCAYYWWSTCHLSFISFHLLAPNTETHTGVAPWSEITPAACVTRPLSAKGAAEEAQPNTA